MTEIVGVKKFSEFDFKFRKKPPGKYTHKETFYWICESHCPPGGWEDSSSSSSNSDEND